MNSPAAEAEFLFWDRSCCIVASIKFRSNSARISTEPKQTNDSMPHSILCLLSQFISFYSSSFFSANGLSSFSGFLYYISFLSSPRSILTLFFFFLFFILLLLLHLLLLL